jgi:predicted phosphodiesterase
MIWTDETINTVKAMLGKRTKIDKNTLAELSRVLGEPITYSKIRHAFARRGLGTPQKYLDVERLVEETAKDVELMTRRRTNGGSGMALGTAIAQVEDRLGATLDEIDPNLAASIKDATMTIVEENTRRASLLREARSRTGLENQLATLAKSFLDRVGHLKTPFNRIPLSYPDNPSQNSYIFAPIADVHVGKTWTDKYGVVRYDKSILTQRIAEIKSKLVPLLQKTNCDLVVWFAGDIFEAPLGNMRKNQQSKMDLIGKDSYVFARDLITSLMIELRASTLGKVTLLLTGGNHDRLTEEKEYSSEDFMIYLLGDAIASRLSDVAVCVLPPIASVPIGNTEFILLHGHRTKLRNENDVRRLVENHGETSHRKIILQGHYHHMRFLSGKKWDCVTVPSVCGLDDFSQYDINQCSDARWLFYVGEGDQPRMIGPQFFSV